ncbi:MAG: hypothetical protein CMK00_07595 [Planctomycetes bacterium]|jgi:nucleoid-associated protein YgaU|nr:hypothetical protein [Planctomycetota bacterium]HJO27680.1 LysM peptidoglycan-binding domain-containing protein [Planctomycetota bacterium]
MGKAEKIIVLTVLLAISGILAVSLNTAGKGARGPLTRAAQAPTDQVQTGPVPPAMEVLAAERAATPQAAPALLAATLTRRESAPAPLQGSPAPESVAEPAPLPGAFPAPEGSALVSLADLEPSGRPDYYFYTWRRGDTFVKVAQRLYGDGNHRELLRRHNEGRLDVPMGDQIFVPVFDDGSSPDPLAGGGRLHTVKEGDSLWTIAGEVYGSGARWQRIFDANRDQLQNANQLKSGMVLRIP